MGLRALPRSRAEAVHASQLRAADRLIGIRTAVALLLITFVNLLCQRHMPGPLLVFWSGAALALRLPLMLLQRKHVRTGYAGIGRRTIIGHALLSLAHGLVWSAPLLFFVQGTGPIEMVALWTLASCLLTAVAIGLSPVPLSALAFLLPVGGSSVLMMTQQSDPLLTATVAIYTLLLIVASLRQAHEFGEQVDLTTQLAENRDVVSLLLKEHAVEEADWLWQTDADHVLRDVAPGFARMLGVTDVAVEGLSIHAIVATPDGACLSGDQAHQIFTERLQDREAFAELVLAVIVQGEQRWWELSASPRFDDAGAFLGFRGVGSDVTTRKLSAERIAQLARHDMLTDLPNRLSLTEELTIAIDHMERWNRRCAFMLIDLDGFKAVNDRFGHQVGDELLALIAVRLRQVCSSSAEMVGRLGGDEFAVLLREVPDRTHLFRIAEAIIEAVSRPYMVGEHLLHVGASIGSATAPQDGRTANALVRAADLAMYRAKEAGGHRHFAFEPAMQADIEERQMLEASLRDALARDQFHIVYQPIVRARDGELVGFEALLRWTHPALGPIAPARFIPVAEEARLMAPIGAWALRNACTEAMRWPAHIRVAVNISPEQLRDPEFLETIVSALAHSGLSPDRLELDMTESAFLRPASGTLQLLDRLIRLGVHLVLDDFGTGQSSIGYLARARFGAIKIDRAFVNGATRGQRESLAIIRAAVAMADSLGMAVTAEGVETIAEYECVRAMGCGQAQGYYFSRPIQAGEVRKLFGTRDSQVA